MSVIPSTPAKCEFCGEPLATREVELFGVKRTVTCYGSCGCDRSAEKLEREGGTAKTHSETHHRCLKCGGTMQLDDSTGYVCDCPWCGHSCVFSSDLEAFHAESANARKSHALEGTGVPRLYWGCEPDWERAEKVMAGKGFYIQGGNGTLKTLTAASIAKALAEAGKSVRFVSSVKLLSEFKDGYGSNRPESEVFEELNGCDLLVIDDMGKENPTSWAATMLYAVVDGRYGDGKPVVVTTNYDEGEMIARLSGTLDDSTAKAIVSRLCEMTEKVVLDGPDRRLGGTE